MLGLIAAALIGLSQRPEAFVGPDPSIYGQWLAARAIDADQHDAGSVCSTATVTSVGGSPSSPILKAPPPGEFINTMMIEHLLVEGCGRAHRINYMVFRLTSGGWMASRMLDGDSRTGALLQRDGLKTAVMAFVAGAHCASADEARSTLKFGPAKLLDRSRSDGGWDELWSASVCGSTVSVKMNFTPDAVHGGTNFAANIVQPDGQPLPPRPPAN